MRPRLVVGLMGLVVVCAIGLVAGLGCKNTAAKMSEMPYYVQMMDERWGVALNYFRNEPDKGISMLKVLISDLDNLKMTMADKYQAGNRDACIAKLDEVIKNFNDDLAKQVNMQPVETQLLPNVKAGDVMPTVEKAHKEYQALRAMIKV